VIEVFGIEGYRSAMSLPLRLIVRAAEIARMKDAQSRLSAITDASLAAGLKLGQKYVDPANPTGSRKSGEPYYTLEPLRKHQDALDAIAHPWRHTLELRVARRIAEEEADFRALEAAMGAK
jgi:hypothetical protein